jgi:transposase
VSPRPFRPWSPDQGQLLPQYVREVLGPEHLACFFVDLAGVLDFSPVLESYTSDRGYPAYHPVMMTLLLMYAYAEGVTSSRKLSRRCRTDLGFRFVSGGAQPDHDTICAFRVRHLAAFGELFDETLRVASEMKLKKLGHISVDGSKFRANASKHKAMSYGRMDETMRKLHEQVQRLLAEAARIDEEEDRLYGKGVSGDEMPEELADPAVRLQRMREARQRVEAEKKRALAREKEQRRAKIAEAKKALEEQARAKAAEQGKPEAEAKPDPKAQRNFTDPESRIMPKDGSFEQAYNAQVAADADTQLIVAQDVIQSTNDAGRLDEMVGQTIGNTGLVPAQVSADSAYLAEADVKAVEARGTKCFVAAKRAKHGEAEPPAPRGRAPASLTWRQRMARKLKTKRGREAYARRKVTVEPVFGQIKNRGFRRFSLRGLFKVRGEFSLVCAVHNLVKLFRMGALAPATG